MLDHSDLIHRYSRSDALRDGVLIDVSPTVQEAGFHSIPAHRLNQNRMSYSFFTQSV
jgi:hypothetical protein